MSAVRGQARTSDLTELQSEIAESVEQVLDRRGGENSVIGVEDVWLGAAAGGWFDIADPASGSSLPDLVVLSRSLGRALACGPIAATLTAVRVASAADDDELRGELAEARHRVGVAILTDGAVADGRITGTARIRDHAPGSPLLVLHRTGAGLITAESARACKPSAVDPSASIGRVDLDRAAVSSWVAGREWSHVHTLLVAAYLAGVARRAVDMSVEYSLVREQFGHAIGWFQAVKHRCADMHVRATAAWAQTLYAARTEPVPPGFEVAAAFSLAADAAKENASDNIRVHGAIGFTADALPHWLVRRAAFETQFTTDRAELRRELISPADADPEEGPNG